MGSGKRLHYAYEKYGIEHFTKEILKFFNTRKEVAEYEAEIVNEVLIKDTNCYNISCGGDGWKMVGTATMHDENGNYFRVNVDDPRVLSGEVVSMNKGKTLVKDINGNFYNVSVNDPRYISGELKPAWCGRKHSPETIEKFKNTYKRIGHQQGEKNSQFGTCWITKDGINKKIKKEELIDYINNGWIKGRKIKK